jgi:hypothetical protein
LPTCNRRAALRRWPRPGAGDVHGIHGGLRRQILQASEDGDVFVIHAGPLHKVIATNRLGEPIFASPALSNGVIYIRGEKHLYAIAESGVAGRRQRPPVP